MPKRFPDHRDVFLVQHQTDNMLDTDFVGVSTGSPISDVQGMMPAFAPTT